MKNCSICGLVNPDSAQLCDCGFSFETGQQQASPLAIREQKLRNDVKVLCACFGGLTMLLGWPGLMSGAIVATIAYSVHRKERPRAAGEGLAAYGIGVAIVAAITLVIPFLAVFGTVASKTTL